MELMCLTAAHIKATDSGSLGEALLDIMLYLYSAYFNATDIFYGLILQFFSRLSHFTFSFV